MIYPFAYRKRYEDKFHHHLIADVSSFAENKSREEKGEKKVLVFFFTRRHTTARDESMTRQRDTIHHPSACPSVHSTAPRSAFSWKILAMNQHRSSSSSRHVDRHTASHYIHDDVFLSKILFYIRDE
jgi:hypothetical protein